jgi:glycosyltransferase involved in cell wall biosynthesis
MRRLGFTRPLYWTFNMAGLLPSLERLNARRWVYHCLDHMPHGSAAEEERLTRGAGSVFAVSSALVDRLGAWNANTHRLPNGVDDTWFQPAAAKPLPGLDGLPPDRPVVGFLGTIFRHLDVVLLEKVARAFPAAELVLVGPLLKGMYGPVGAQMQAFERLKSLPNVRVLGFQDRQDLPLFVERYDVCLMPFLDNEFVRCSDPLKFYEYSSRGKPVITTQLPLVEQYRDLCYISASHEEFVANVGRALNESKTEALTAARRQIARRHSWRFLIGQAVAAAAAQEAAVAAGPAGLRP